MGSCGLSGHLAAFSVSGSGADMSPSSGQKPALSTLTKKHTESQFLPSVSYCVCLHHSDLTAVRQPKAEPAVLSPGLGVAGEAWRSQAADAMLQEPVLGLGAHAGCCFVTRTAVIGFKTR